MPTTSTSESDAIIGLLNAEEFKIPVTQDGNEYFPDYLKSIIENYLTYYDDHLSDSLHNIRQGDEGSKVELDTKTHGVANVIINTINYYYEGKIHKATEIFNAMLDSINLASLGIDIKINVGENFYRARRSEANKIKRGDIFHNPFEKRNFVNTSRYSVPGLPALYLGGSIYVCWEEFDRPSFKELFFSRFNNKLPLNVIKIQRLEDFYKDLPLITNPNHWEQEYFLLFYIFLFPLLLACSVKTRESKGSFKPEYIIPQLLLQYVANNEAIDGIMFPSTKVDYNKIDNVSAYNYVFPVKNIVKEGFCTALLEKFDLTEPTSLELESLIDYSEIRARGSEYVNPLPGSLIIVEGVNSPYIKTSFGRIEEILLERVLASPTD